MSGLTVIAKADRDALNGAEAFAASLEPKLRKAFLAAVEATKGKADIKKLAAAIASGNIAEVLAALGLTDIEAAYAGLRDEVRAGISTAATAASASIALSFRFDALATPVVDFLRAYSYRLIREVTKEQVSTIRGIMHDGMVKGVNPRTTAREVRTSIGLTGKQYQAVARFRAELETFHQRKSAGSWNLGGKISRAAGGAQTMEVDAEGNPLDGIFSRRLRDYRYDGVLQRAIAQRKPLTPEQIDRMVAAYERKYLRYRSETIARTEALRAANEGNRLAWEQAAEQGKVQAALVRRRWIVAKDERACPVCRPIPRLNAGDEGFGIPPGQSFQTPKGAVAVPPAHPNCRCVVFTRAIEPSMVGRKVRTETQWAGVSPAAAGF